MNDRKNIDKLFQEQFKDFEAQPPEQTWEELERRLKKKKDRKIVPIWWRFAGIAAALLIGFTIGDQIGLFNGGQSVPNQVVVEENTGRTNDKPGTGNEKPTSDAIVDATPDSVSTNNPVAEKTNPVSGENNKPTPQENFKTTHKQNAVAHQAKRKKDPASDKKRSIGNVVPSDENKTVVASHEKPSAGSKTASDVRGNESKISVQDPLQKQRESMAENAKINIGNKKSDTNPSIAPNVRQEVAHQNNTNLKSSEAAAANRTTDNLAGGNQKTALTKDHTTDVINPVAANEDQKQEKKLDSTAIATVPNALEELLNEKEKKITKEPKLNRWQVTSNIAPIYFGSTSGGSPIDSTFAGKSKDYQTQVSYGIGASYAINKRLAVRTGVNKVSLSYDTNDVELYASLSSGGLKNVDMPAGNETLNFSRGNNTSRSGTANRTESAVAVGDLTTDKFSGTINQKMGYIEVPLELTYAVVDRKFGINVIAGVSTLFLNDNKIELTSDGLKTDLGQASNLNKTHFSSNVGLGLKYRFLKSFEANFEPIFKYQINTFSKDSGDFKPYFFGLYTGVSFRF